MGWPARIGGLGAGLVLAGLVAAIIAWLGLLDDQPPRLQATLPARPLSGSVELRISAEDATPGLRSVQVIVDGKEILAPARGWTLDTRSLEDGPHTLEVIATDASLRRNSTQRRLSFEVDNRPPQLDLARRSTRVAQGEVLAVVLRADEELEGAMARVLGQERPLYPLDSGLWRALVGVPVSAPPGPHPLVIEATDLAGNRVSREASLQVESFPFRQGGFIKLSGEQTKARTDKEAIRAMREERNAAFQHEQPVQHWEGGMLRPVQGRLTSPFGQYRLYSDGQRKHHFGTDIANVTGTPVRAASTGEVRVAGWQHLFGNVVILHHGQGVSTSYNHLSAIEVAVGDIVEKGEVVGRVGSTGQSTGPHLHWGMQVMLVEVDPERWPEDGFAAEGFSDFLPLLK